MDGSKLPESRDVRSSARQKKDVVGSTIVSKTLLSDIENFWFSVEADAIVRPFDFVSVKNAKADRVIGIVDNLQVVPLDEADAYSNGMMVAKAAILANTPSSAIPVMPGRKVSLADENEVLYALGIPEMLNPVPAGVIQLTNGLQIPFSLDVSYLAGPDTAHINAAGISGNRKTSYLLFLLQSASQKLSREGVAIIIFNTKEQELLQIDSKDDEKFSKEDAKLFKLLGLDTEPFSNVIYCLPRGSDGNPNSVLVPKNSKPYSYELGDIHDRLELLFSQTADPRYDEILSIVNHIDESWPIKNGLDEITTWSDLAAFTQYPEEVVSYRSALAHFLGYLHKFRKSPLFVDRRKTSVYLGSEVKKIKAGQVYVIDIARLPTLEEQSLVVGDVMRAVDQMYAAKRLTSAESGKYMIIFVDEINRFLPSSVPGVKRMSATAEQIMRTVIAGKARNTLLFSAQQFKSTVDGALHENTGTHTFSKLGATELATPSYAMLSEHTKGNIVRLNKGEVIMTHPAFRHPIKVTFPRVSFKRP
nr:hypothetical protein [uncultured Nitrososphaera sp.]